VGIFALLVFCLIWVTMHNLPHTTFVEGLPAFWLGRCVHLENHTIAGATILGYACVPTAVCDDMPPRPSCLCQVPVVLLRSDQNNRVGPFGHLEGGAHSL
jgi:hypothetical protein